MWLDVCGKQSQLLKLNLEILSLRSLTADTVDGNFLQKWLAFYKVSITFEFQKFTKLKRERFFVVVVAVFLFVCMAIIGES